MKNKFKSLIMKSKIIILGHILNPLWLPHDQRRKRRKTAIADAKVDYLKIYEKEVKSMRPTAMADNNETKERLFTLWLQGEQQAPPIVKACIRSMRRYSSLPVVVLDETNIFDWITLPPHIIDKWKSGLISRTHFSDICRIELLYEHGGVWADSTDFFTSYIPESIMNQDFFMFMAGDNLKLGGTHAFIQNCFMRIRSHHPLLGMWRELVFFYWKNENNLLDYFTHQFLFRFLVENNTEAASLFAEMPRLSCDPTHVLYWGYKDSTYTPEFYRQLTENTFFQKTTYKDSSAKSPKPGSMAEYIINS